MHTQFKRDGLTWEEHSIPGDACDLLIYDSFAMNSLISIVILALAFSAGNVDAVCPFGVAAGLCEGGLCPPDYTCINNECCPNTCVDQLAECPQRVAQCSVSSYRVFMTSYCARTCNRCGVINCYDSDPRCTTWVAQGFCQNIYYDTATKLSLCRASCGYC